MNNIMSYDEYLHGSCHQWVLDNFRPGDKIFVMTDYDYDIAVKVWSKRDVLKRETARKNNLNYLEVFSMDVNDVIKKFINTISILKSSYE